MSDNVVAVPKPSRSSYNPNRPLAKNQLLQAHVQHVHEAERHLPRERRTGIDIKSIQTEGQAAEYIKKVTALLHELPQRVKTAT